MKKIISSILGKFGYTVVKNKNLDKSSYPDIKEKEFWEIYALCKPYTMTSIERMYSLYCSVNYILSNNIEGDLVECGVWKGGSAMLMAKMLTNRSILNRKLYLYDTFEGMSQPTNFDLSHSGEDASAMFNENSDWCLAGLDEVKNNISKTNFPSSNTVYVVGKIEDTLPENKPAGEIALLRLDTDWYESTKHELIVLYPLVAQNGVLIIDDYGHWQGCRKAVDEYFSETKLPIFLNRIDYTGRIAIKNFY